MRTSKLSRTLFPRRCLQIHRKASLFIERSRRRMPNNVNVLIECGEFALRNSLGNKIVTKLRGEAFFESLESSNSHPFDCSASLLPSFLQFNLSFFIWNVYSWARGGCGSGYCPLRPETHNALVDSAKHHSDAMNEACLCLAYSIRDFFPAANKAREMN